MSSKETRPEMQEASAADVLSFGKTHFEDYRCHIPAGGLFEYVVKSEPRIAKIKTDVANEMLRQEYPTEVPNDIRAKIEFFIHLWRNQKTCGDDEDCNEILDILKLRNADIEAVISGPTGMDVLIANIYVDVYKQKSFDRVSQEGVTEFKGFDDSDLDMSDLPQLLKEMFGNNLLRQCLVSKVLYYPDIVSVTIRGEEFYLPKDKYHEWKQRQPEVQKYKTRADNFSSQNRSGAEFKRVPVIVYSFEDEDLNQFEYLSDIPDKEKMRRYKVGTISHEFGHSLYEYLLDSDKRSKWRQIIDETGHLTVYSKKYSTGVHGDDIAYDEEFAEAVRLRTTASDYMRKHFPKVSLFFDQEFPDIKSVNNIDVK